MKQKNEKEYEYYRVIDESIVYQFSNSKEIIICANKQLLYSRSLVFLLVSSLLIVAMIVNIILKFNWFAFILTLSVFLMILLTGIGYLYNANSKNNKWIIDLDQMKIFNHNRKKFFSLSNFLYFKIKRFEVINSESIVTEYDYQLNLKSKGSEISLINSNSLQIVNEVALFLSIKLNIPLK